ncbi:N-6 DNA methylase [Herbaspirillum seropedicae]|uniref:SAM-dependent methyltransferase n=1 Tax=Herbaspirillum seropedicae TaxID=964 RepID=UPI0028602C74|nr:SAM-dependent methyltransferase [Herbaspirillum seropedicae]MDR6397969.1 site-specific DNA-methyltransferase (adenine-specific) [Herbaspirillum seropedicae]
MRQGLLIPFETGAAGGEQEGRAHSKELGQYFTPSWAAELIYEKYFDHLGTGDLVIEPACGDGSFLAAVPAGIGAIGVEIDPVMAAWARANTGREVITGDFLSVDLPCEASAIVGNPPFQADLVHRFLDRSWSLLREGGAAGFILPAYVLQTSTVVNRLNERWTIEQQLLPRNLFPRLKLPIVYSVFRKERARRLIGFFLYAEASQVAQLQKECRKIADRSGKGETWRTVTRFALQALGGEADLAEIYQSVEPRRPSKANRFWEARIRNVLQKSGEFQQVARGRWRVVDAEAVC